MSAPFAEVPALVETATKAKGQPRLSVGNSHAWVIAESIFIHDNYSGEHTMRRFLTALAILAALTLSAAAQDWYHEREERFRGEHWRGPHLHARANRSGARLERAARPGRNARGLQKTEEELTKMQADLDQGRFDNGILNDVIDSIRKSSNDDRLAPRDRDVLADDLIRLKDYQDHHDHWR